VIVVGYKQRTPDKAMGLQITVAVELTATTHTLHIIIDRSGGKEYKFVDRMCVL
jgi:hypothetical protein